MDASRGIMSGTMDRFKMVCKIGFESLSFFILFCSFLPLPYLPVTSEQVFEKRSSRKTCGLVACFVVSFFVLYYSFRYTLFFFGLFCGFFLCIILLFFPIALFFKPSDTLDFAIHSCMYPSQLILGSLFYFKKTI